MVGQPQADRCPELTFSGPKGRSAGHHVGPGLNSVAGLGRNVGVKVCPGRLAGRLGAAALAAGLSGVLGLVAGPSARADVVITPSQAVQGGTARLTFFVLDDRGNAYTTKVEVQLPAQAPIGEVDPLSVPGWAPLLTYRKLGTPVPGIHSARTTTVASAVTWTRAPGPVAAGTVNELILSMGPLPKVDRLDFTVLQTYSDHAVRRWSTAGGSTASGSAPTAGIRADGVGPVLTLTPATGTGTSGNGTSMQGMAGMQGMDGMSGSHPAGALGARSPLPTGDASPDAIRSLKILDIGLTACVALNALWGAWLVVRARRALTFAFAPPPSPDTRDSRRSPASPESPGHRTGEHLSDERSTPGRRPRSS